MQAMGIVYIIIGLVGGFGWGSNVYTLTQFSGTIAEMSAFEIVRFVGIFVPPLGAVLGYF